MIKKSKDLLVLFTRNPELGKCKTRLAATIGEQSALEIYKFLLQHTVDVTQMLTVDKEVHYSVKIRENDIWNSLIYSKKKQVGNDLGARMYHAFCEGFDKGYQHIIIMGSDLYDITQNDIETAFEALNTHDFVVGPAVDGGYYLLGMKILTSTVFKNKEWGTNTVLKDTLEDLKGKNVKILDERNDIDYFEDIKDIDVFQQFLKKT
ncbi:TIGR04282 family arsenosugar biosynthesis glycosyltransferase [Aquimarina sp. W85]|uniref:TIGR04282 family arsenosugar biosynthesis glycosyltransferase n=1 Tax=Aquimarina rhodophyticola TaxID=3342246 RepID=UPI00366E20DA